MGRINGITHSLQGVVTCYARTWIDPKKKIAIFNKTLMKISTASRVSTQQEAHVKPPQTEAENTDDESGKCTKKQRPA